MIPLAQFSIAAYGPAPTRKSPRSRLAPRDSSIGLVVVSRSWISASELFSDEPAGDTKAGFHNSQRDIDGEIKWWPDSASFMAGIRSVPRCDLVT